MKDNLPTNILITVIAGICVGLVSGAACVFFCYVTTVADLTRQAQPWLLWFLPLAGLVVVFLYDELFERESLSTGSIFLFVHENQSLNVALAPLIFISTSLAYLTGGSVGRAGSALQIGAGTATILSSFLPEKTAVIIYENMATEFYARLLMSCGMACGFTAILDAPLAGALFGIEVLALSYRNWILLIPTLISSLITWAIAHAFHIPYTDLHGAFASGMDAFDGGVFWRVCIIALLTTLTARLYCKSRDLISDGFLFVARNKYLRVIIGTGLVILITKLLGTMIYNGIGFSSVAEMTTIGTAALVGRLTALGFFWKLLLTLLTLCCGIRGGEIAPNIFIGAAFGCVAGEMLGLDPCLGAACGIVGNLSSVTNCTLSLFVFGLEALSFGPASAIYFGAVVLITHVLSGHCCLYTQQPTSEMPFKPDIL